MRSGLRLGCLWACSTSQRPAPKASAGFLPGLLPPSPVPIEPERAFRNRKNVVQNRDTTMASKLEQAAKDRGIKYFLVSFADLKGSMRAKLVPAVAIAGMEEDGAGFAGFATWLDMSPADGDILAVPDPDSLIQLPWQPEVGWVAGDLWMNGEPVEQAPRNVLKRVIEAGGKHNAYMRSGVELEFS